jgi:hypothetical protein
MRKNAGAAVIPHAGYFETSNTSRDRKGLPLYTFLFALPAVDFDAGDHVFKLLPATPQR